MPVMMAEVELVDGSGCISDESDFYGDEATREKFEKKANRKLKIPSPLFPDRAKTTDSPQKLSAKTPKEQDDGNVLDFLKSRPQIAALQKGTKAGIREPAKNRADAEASEVLDDDRFEGDPAAWQQHETVLDFLRRAPVNKPSTAGLGPWLWVSNPKIKASWKQREVKTDVQAFVTGSIPLLEANRLQRDKLEQANPTAAPATITRKMGPYRDQLEGDLLTMAVKTGTTCGKWMLFPNDDDYPRTWRLVAEATAEGKLGAISKAATPSDVDPLNLICVYTFDFTNIDDVSRVLEGLIDLGACTRDGKPIYYKCDAYTYLNIKSDNGYKLRASLYSSKEILGQETKVKVDGRIDRLKKHNKTIDSFFSS